MIKIEIWSDINCPFCYIGKRHLERALQNFNGDYEIEWKSFELDPHTKPAKGSDQTELLAKKYGRDRKWAEGMNANMTAMASESGLNFKMADLVPANSFNAHRLLHFAKTRHLQDQLKERLFKARYEEGLDIDDNLTLAGLASEVGLKPQEVSGLLSGDDFSADVRTDEKIASELGISGVPFFVFNKKYALSGAQPMEIFSEILNKVKAESLN
jgi:predicted DsbA family dithiol-disulfide isomerase